MKKDILIEIEDFYNLLIGLRTKSAIPSESATYILRVEKELIELRDYLIKQSYTIFIEPE